MKLSRVFFAATLAISGLSFSYAADTITGTVITGSGPATKFLLESGTPFVLDELRVEKYVGFVGCLGFDTSRLQNKVTVGRYVAIETTPVFNDAVVVQIKYIASKFDGIQPFETSKGCVINNSAVTLFETMPTIYLKRGEIQTIEMMTLPSIHKIQLLLE